MFTLYEMELALDVSICMVNSIATARFGIHHLCKNASLAFIIKMMNSYRLVGAMEYREPRRTFHISFLGHK